MELPDTPLPQCKEGASAFDRFKGAMRQLLSQPREEYEEREAEYQERQAAKAKRPGPKPKVKPFASGRASRAKG